MIREILAVGLLFVLRIGIPLLILITIGTVVERIYQRRRHKA